MYRDRRRKVLRQLRKFHGIRAGSKHRGGSPSRGQKLSSVDSPAIRIPRSTWYFTRHSWFVLNTSVALPARSTPVTNRSPFPNSALANGSAPLVDDLRARRRSLRTHCGIQPLDFPCYRRKGQRRVLRSPRLFPYFTGQVCVHRDKDRGTDAEVSAGFEELVGLHMKLQSHFSVDLH